MAAEARIKKIIWIATSIVGQARRQPGLPRIVIMVLYGVAKGRKKRPIQLEFWLEGQPFRIVDSFRYLRVILDDYLLWNKHIEYLCAKAKNVIPKILTICCNIYSYSYEARLIRFDGVCRRIFPVCGYSVCTLIKQELTKIASDLPNDGHQLQTSLPYSEPSPSYRHYGLSTTGPDGDSILYS